ncbi:MAG: helix-turn-helix domain-containing protein [Gemmataceae bacterium]
MLTVRQAAARATVCEGTVRGWLRDGVLPHYRLGAKGRRGKILIDPADLAAVLAAAKVGPRPPAPPAPAPTRRPVLKHLRLP